MVVVGILMMAGIAWGVPEVGFVAPGPGLNVPFDNITASNPLTYGIRTIETGTWTYDADTASTSSSNACLEYFTTQTNSGTSTPMPANKDWVFEIKYKYVGEYNGEVPWIAYAEGDNRIISLWHDNTTSWSIRAGNNSGGWFVVASGLDLGSSFHIFTTQYKAANQRLDIYMDGNLLASNIALGHGVYTLKQVHIQVEDNVSQATPPVHAIEDAIGSSNGSSIINVVTYYKEHSSEYPEININNPTNSNWTPLLQDLVDDMDASRGRIIFFPGGLYRCSSTININKPASAPLTFMGVGGGIANGNIEGSVLKYTGSTDFLKVYGPAYCFNLKDLQLEGPGRDADQTAVRGDSNNGYIARCYFENLKINNFKRGFYFLGYADGMVFRDIRFSNIDRCINLQHSDTSVIENIEADPFYGYVLYLYQASGLLVNNIRAKSNMSGRVFVLTGSGPTGKSIEINGVYAEDVNNLATVTCSNVSLKNFYYHVSSGNTVTDDAIIFANLGSLQPLNCLIENATFELTGVTRGTKKDISLRTGGEAVNLVETNPTAGYGSSCNGLRIINSELDTSDIPTTLYYGSYIGVEKYSKGIQWVGNQRKWSYGTACPTYAGNQGDIVWNTQPVASGYAGWVCVGGSTWKGFCEITN